MRVTTVGQLLINEALPADLRRDRFDIDKKGVRDLLREVVERHPDKYREVAHKLMALGHFAAESTGNSINLSSLRQSPEVAAEVEALKAKVRKVAESSMPDDKKEELITSMVMDRMEPMQKAIYAHGLSTGSPYALQAKSGSRGNASQLQQLIAGDGLVMDHRDRIISVPVLNGYAQGLEPAEYFAGAYGARKGTISTKSMTAKAGFFGKRLAQAAHRLVVTEEDCGTTNGLPVPANDPDNVGSVLATPVGGYKAGTIITPSVLKDLGKSDILVRSAITCQAGDGICAKCAGVRERGKLPEIGDNIGIPAAQAISERVSQGALSEKHKGGQAKAKFERSGFKYLDQLIETPEGLPGEATLATVDGRIKLVEPAPQGGNYVHVGQEKLYVPPNQAVTVKPGDEVEAGDSLSDGVANPAQVVAFKGIGEGRRYFMNTFMEGLKNSGIPAHRRNIEALTRGLINHVQVTASEGASGFLPDDVASYDDVTRGWEPRQGSLVTPIRLAADRYLEAPALHYTIGTRVTPRVAMDLARHGVKEVNTSQDPAPFEPVMLKAVANIRHDPNWMTRMYGSHLSKGFHEAVHRARGSEQHSTSFVPAVAEAVDFGKDLSTKGHY